MKKLWISALAGMTLWTAMTLTEAALEMTQPSQAAQNNTYTFTVIAEFGPLSGFEPSACPTGRSLLTMARWSILWYEISCERHIQR